MAVDPGGTGTPLFADIRSIWASTVAVQARALALAAADGAACHTAAGPPQDRRRAVLAYLLENTVDADDVILGSVTAL